MNFKGFSFTSAAILLMALLPVSSGPVHARDANAASFAAAQRSKQTCTNVCRSRYRDCLSLKQISSYECRGVYQDCVRYTCTGAGPG